MQKFFYLRKDQLVFSSVLFLTVLSLVSDVHGHGRMMEPPSRNTLWRFGYKAPVNYNDNELFCGGLGGITRNAGKCGICGDPYDGPRLHETGNLMAPNETTRNYYPGSSIDVMIEIVANHGGRFKFEMCWRDEWDDIEAEDCFEQLQLSARNDEEESTNRTQYELDPRAKTGTFTMSLDLPENRTCERCILRWHWRSGNNWGVCEDGSQAVGCGHQEVYRNCADVSVKRNGAGIGFGMRHQK